MSLSLTLCLTLTRSTQALRTGAGRVTACDTEAGSSRWHESMQVRVRGEEVHLARVGDRVSVMIRAGVWVNVSRIRARLGFGA